MASNHEHTRAEALAQLILEQEWSTGAWLGLGTGQLYLRLLQSCPRLTLIGVGLIERQTFEALNRAVARFGERAVLVRATPEETLTIAREASLDFVVARDDGDIFAWRPKLTPDGWIIAWPRPLVGKGAASALESAAPE